MLLLGLVLGCAHVPGSRASAAAESALALEQRLASEEKRIAEIRDARGPAAALGEVAQHEDPAIRVATVRALGAIGAASAVPLLLTALDDDDGAVRSAAAFAIASHWSWVLGPVEPRAIATELELALVQSLRAVEDQAAPLELGDRWHLLFALGEFDAGATSPPPSGLLTIHPRAPGPAPPCGHRLCRCHPRSADPRGATHPSRGCLP